MGKIIGKVAIASLVVVGVAAVAATALLFGVTASLAIPDRDPYYPFP